MHIACVSFQNCLLRQVSEILIDAVKWKEVIRGKREEGVERGVANITHRQYCMQCNTVIYNNPVFFRTNCLFD